MSELCDGVDNDCDGVVDNGLGSTTCGAGACRRTVSNCVAGALQSCTPGPASPEICTNGIDDDCDGATDSMDTDCVSATYSVVVRCDPPAGWTVLEPQWGTSSTWNPYTPTNYATGGAFEFRASLAAGDFLLITFPMRDNLGNGHWAFDFSSPPGSGAVGRPLCAATTATRNGAAMPLHYVANGSSGSLPCNYTNLLVPTPGASPPPVCW